jgi:8-oxo-dGTP diphosphatase
MVFPRAFSSYTPKYCISDHVYGVILITCDRETAVICGRKTGKWSFPKGHGNRDERPLEAALRELKEETGICMSGSVPDNEIHFKGSTYFVYTIINKPDLYPEDINEVMDVMWAPIHRLPFLFGNRDLNAFCRMSIDTIIDRIEFKKSQYIHAVDILVSI